jgi:hypothetical protein
MLLYALIVNENQLSYTLGLATFIKRHLMLTFY